MHNDFVPKVCVWGGGLILRTYPGVTGSRDGNQDGNQDGLGFRVKV
jgi:hypothetical protein